MREKFVAEVQRITWAYKLAETTINLPGTTAVPEIQVFQIDAKGDDVSESVLAAIDKAVKTPIIFEITRGDGPERRTRMVATHKTPRLRCAEARRLLHDRVAAGRRRPSASARPRSTCPPSTPLSWNP